MRSGRMEGRWEETIDWQMAETGHGVWIMVKQGGRLDRERAEREGGEVQMNGESVTLPNECFPGLQFNSSSELKPHLSLQCASLAPRPKAILRQPFAFQEEPSLELLSAGVSVRLCVCLNLSFFLPLFFLALLTQTTQTRPCLNLIKKSLLSFSIDKCWFSCFVHPMSVGCATSK